MASRSRHLIDPEILPLLDVFPHIAFSLDALPQIRARFGTPGGGAATLPAHPGIARMERRVPGPDGAPAVRVVVYLPPAAPRPLPALLWVHGGGYVLGSAADDDATLAHIVAAIGCAAVSVDYRLAPETPFPGAVEDCYAALVWLHAHAAELEVDAGRLAIGGASSGGGLAAALALLTRDRGVVPLAFQWLIYPMLDDRTGATSDSHPYAGEFVWTPAHNRFAWAALLGREPGGADVSPYAAAARAASLAGLPPAFISVGALDLFVEENIEYARRLIRDGVPTELHVYPGAFHSFNAMSAARVARAHARDSLDGLRRALHPRPATPPPTPDPTMPAHGPEA